MRPVAAPPAPPIAASRRRVFGLVLPLMACFVAAATSHAAIWTAEDTRLTPVGLLALTAPGRQAVARLPAGHLYAVWYERSAPQAAVVRGAERNEFGTWTADPTVLSLGDSLVRNPVLAVGPAGDLHLAWEDLRDGSEQIYYRHRTPGGVWEEEEPITTDAGESLDPVLGVGESGRLHLVWSDAVSGNKELYYCQRDPGGAMTPPRRLTNHPGQSIQPNFVVDGVGDLHLVWQDGILDGGTDVNFNSEIWYMPLDADGAPRAAPVRVSRALGLSQKPGLALGADGSIHMVWSDGRDPAPNNPGYFPMAIWYRRWLPGLGFGHEKRFFYSGADHLNPAVATTPDGTINIVWEDYIHGNSELYYRQINLDTGWDVRPTRLTNTVGPTRAPSLLADADGTMHLVWSDAGSGEEGSIRYRTGQAAGTTPVRLAGRRIVGTPDGVRLEWRTSEEIDHAGFMLYAGGAADDDAERIGPLIRGGPDYAALVSWTELGAASVIKLAALGRDGRIETVALFHIPAEPAPTAIPLWAGDVSPNPVLGAFRLEYRLASAGEVTVTLFDPQGRRVAGKALGRRDAGLQTLEWSLPAGRRAAWPAGRYFLRLAGPGGVITRSIVVVR